MIDVAAIYKAAGMDSNGFYPQHPCKACGKPLQGDGDGHPAESYAGTYTGLCDVCTRAGGYVEHTYRDGAQRWSYPPHCPAWRRDRETFHAYPDCQTCQGSGRLYVSRSCAVGGSYYSYCPQCFERFYGEPLRAEHSRRSDQIARDAQDAYSRDVKALAKRTHRKVTDIPAAELADLARAHLDRRTLAMAELQAWSESEHVWD